MIILGSLVLTMLTVAVFLVYVWIYLRTVKSRQDATMILILGATMSIIMLYTLTEVWISTFELIALRGA